MLRGKKPELIKRRLKAMFYGEPGVGKSFASCSFPNPYYIDCERGVEHQQYVDLLNTNNGAVFSCQDFYEVEKEVRALMTTPHDYKTLVIDPITILYDNLLEKFELKNDKNPGYNKHYMEANRVIKNFTNLLLKLDMNVILCARSKIKYVGNMVEAGATFDCSKALPYVLDLSLEVRKSGDKREAIVRKSRLEGFVEGEVIPFSYQEISKRYDIEIIEKDPEFPVLIKEDQLTFIDDYLSNNPGFGGTLRGWLDKNDYHYLKEITQEEANKWIEFINNRYQKQEQGQINE